MPLAHNEDLSRVYPRTWARLPIEVRSQLQRICVYPEDLPQRLDPVLEEYDLPRYLQELAELESAVRECRHSGTSTERHPSSLCLNPSLTMLQLQWGGLLDLMNSTDHQEAHPREDELSRENATGLLWWDPFREKARLEPAQSEDLLVLKMVAEGIDPREIAAENDLSPSRLYTLLQRAKNKGLILGPATRLQRPSELAPEDSPQAGGYQAAEIFTLQWHLTDACDMHCRHCYGGGEAKQRLAKGTAYRVLRDTVEFCQEKNVRGQVTFTGGNPLLHPHFFELYEASVREGFLVTILGNPTDTATLERLVAIEPPALFQVSLEGLREHNDYIRQEGHYDRVLEFLDRLREYGVPSQVMLTLTRANMDQVLPLGEVLRDRADRFTFNRISLVGEGAALQPPEVKNYWAFLEDYLQAAWENPVLRLKDNLLNRTLSAKGAEPFGGCTGFGCGAAFNFLALLPDGGVHACRKFPSPLGHIQSHTLTEIYDSAVADDYRSAPQDCLDCSLAPVCRGCPAVVHSFGGDVFRDRDPYCPLRP